MKRRKKFKALKQFAGKYIVSNDGRVFVGKKEIRQFRSETSKKTRFVRLFKGGKSVSITIGRIVLLTFKPTKKVGKIAVHLDGNPENCNLDNLTWGTRKKQSKIAMKNPVHKKRVRKMGQKYGPENGRTNGKKYGKHNLLKWKVANGTTHTVVTDRMVDRMVKLRDSGNSRAEVAKIMGLHRSTIYNYV